MEALDPCWLCQLDSRSLPAVEQIVLQTSPHLGRRKIAIHPGRHARAGLPPSQCTQLSAQPLGCTQRILPMSRFMRFDEASDTWPLVRQSLRNWRPIVPTRRGHRDCHVQLYPGEPTLTNAMEIVALHPQFGGRQAIGMRSVFRFMPRHAKLEQELLKIRGGHVVVLSRLLDVQLHVNGRRSLRRGAAGRCRQQDGDQDALEVCHGQETYLAYTRQPRIHPRRRSARVRSRW